MARRLLLLVDAALVVAAALLGARLYQAATAPRPLGLGETVTSAGVGASEPLPPPAPEAARAPQSAVAAIAERNLFSPTRTETAPEPPRPAVPPGGAAAAARPRLYGVIVLPDGRARAYIEDAQRRRVVAFSVGDTVGDARIDQIRPDRIVLRRGAETFEVLLHDPTKPRAAPGPSPVPSPPGGPIPRPEVRRPGPAGPALGPPGRGIVRPRPMVPPAELPRPDTPEPDADEE